ncbi:MAG: MmgE/PrpD family protein, partial [Castellaniella sp.]
MTTDITKAPVEDFSQSGLTRQLADFVASLTAKDVPDELRGILSNALLDSVGCALFGLTTETCSIIRDFTVAQGGPQESSIWGSGSQRVSAINAVLTNGAAVHGFDFDDHSRAKIHPGAVVIPAAIALAESNSCDGPRFLAAIAAGYEVMNRISLAVGPVASRLKGWHLTGTTGTFGAAAAASVILRLNAQQTAAAFGIAGTQSAGLWAFNADGATTKRLHPGLAARDGLTAAALAKRGFNGGSHILEAQDGGFLLAMSDEPPHPDEITRGLGVMWRAEGACFKPYAACGSNHAAIDAALTIKRENQLAISDIRRVRVGVARVVLV